MEDLKEQMERNYLTYASYVILERAIPDVADGLKPVQRRILHTLRTIHDGKLHKVANVVGQTMAYHPHGDAAINDALVNLANKQISFRLSRKLWKSAYREILLQLLVILKHDYLLFPSIRYSILL